MHTTAEDIRAAAERLRHGEYADSQYVGLWNFSRDKMSDTCELADAYLREHLPDDDEPVTVEWLEEIPLTQFNTNRRLWASKWSSMFIRVVIFRLGDHCRIESANHSIISGPLLKTRRDVRRLCSALGISLNESEAHDAMAQV